MDNIQLYPILGRRGELIVPKYWIVVEVELASMFPVRTVTYCGRCRTECRLALSCYDYEWTEHVSILDSCVACTS